MDERSSTRVELWAPWRSICGVLNNPAGGEQDEAQFRLSTILTERMV